MLISPNDNQSVVLAQETGRGILSRLEWMTLKPKLILNLSSQSDDLTSLLKNSYPDAEVVSRDDMKQCIDLSQLPLTAHSVDLIVANLVLPWCDHASSLLKEMRRVLRQDGLFMLSTIAPGSFDGLQASIVYHEMHELGDAIVQAGMVDPVLDIDHYTFSYQNTQTLFQEWVTSGILLEQTALNDVLQINCEVVYAHAFAGAEGLSAPADQDGAAHFPLSYLRQRLRQG